MEKITALQALTDAIHAANRIALILHVSPDGDTCGSALGLRRALIRLGKDVSVACDHDIPHIYNDLEGADALIKPDALAGVRFDLAIAVDVADCLRMGDSVQVFNAAAQTAQIDHHPTNPQYADINYTRSPLSATAILTLEVIDALNVPLDMPIAHCLFIGISTDTGNFKHQNTDPAALRAAARCVEMGLDVSTITRRVFDLKPIAQMKLIARALESLTLFEDGAISLMALASEDFQQTGALPEHTEGIVNYGINTEGVQIACLLRSDGENIKASLRSLPPYDVARVATALGGGGHMFAAGCTLTPPMPEAQKRILAEMKKELHNHT